MFPIVSKKLWANHYENWICPILGRILFFPIPLLVIVSFVIVFIGEYMLPSRNFSKWQDIVIKHGQFDNPHAIRYLFVGTVQLASDFNSGIANFISTKDSDMFISSSFEKAVSLTKPSDVILIGDILPRLFLVGPSMAKSIIDRFDSIFQPDILAENGIKLSVVFGEHDTNYLSGTCNPTCLEESAKFLSRNLFDNHPCQYFSNKTILMRRFFAHREEINEPQCQEGSPIRFTIQQRPLVHPVLANLKPNNFMQPMDEWTVHILREYAPQVTITSLYQASGVLFCSNCQTLGDGGKAWFPDAQWVPFT